MLLRLRLQQAKGAIATRFWILDGLGMLLRLRLRQAKRSIAMIKSIHTNTLSNNTNTSVIKLGQEAPEPKMTTFA